MEDQDIEFFKLNFLGKTNLVYYLPFKSEYSPEEMVSK